MTAPASPERSTPWSKASSRFFHGHRPYDGTKDDCLLDALQQAIEVMQECEINHAGFSITAEFDGISQSWCVGVNRPNGGTFYGTDVRAALRKAFDAR